MAVRRRRRRKVPLKIERLKVADLKLYPENRRKHDQRNVDDIRASLERFGQQTPIAVSKDDHVLKGNGTLMASEQLGWTEIDCVRSRLTGAEAKAYAIADNRTGETSEWDFVGLAVDLVELTSYDSDILRATGFMQDEIDDIIDKASNAGDDKPRQKIIVKIECPKCGYLFKR